MQPGAPEVDIRDHPLGLLIRDEIARAETDFTTYRTRAQAVLTISGLLVTALAGILTFAVGRDGHLELSPITRLATACTLIFFVYANAMVLAIFMPSTVERPRMDHLERAVNEDWNAKGWQREATQALMPYLRSLRASNKSLADKLALAVLFQLLGVLGAATLALSLIAPVR